MPSESIIAVGIYVLGVVLIPVLAGVAMRSEDIKGSDFWNFCIPIGFISLTWPLVLMMAVGVIAVMIVVVMLPGLVFKLLIKIGQLIGRNMGKGKED